MTRFRRVGMRELVHENQLGFAGQRGVQVKFAQLHSAIFDFPAGNDRQTFGQRVGFLASVRFEVADDDIASGGEFAAGGFEHGVGFAHTGAHAEKNLQAPATGAGRFTLDGGEEMVRIWTLAFFHKLKVTKSTTVA